ncbi:MAG: hypothetical protein LZ166_00720 [Thaumarchaeota archaeon]|jgi:ribosomal protein S27E|nr:hypothetical protein [Nitrososphaerota archaeon]MCL7386037.1 hypothetical protein [Candidatus Wolframiiraptor allenii]
MSAQELVQAARKRKCSKCGKTIVKGEYVLRTGKKAYCLDCAATIVTDPVLKEKIEGLRKGQLTGYTQ